MSHDWNQSSEVLYYNIYRQSVVLNGLSHDWNQSSEVLYYNIYRQSVVLNGWM
jgi:hypothetical protein